MVSPVHCAVPFYGDPGQPDGPVPGQKLYLVSGRNVWFPGAYVSWPSADAQYKSVSNATCQGLQELDPSGISLVRRLRAWGARTSQQHRRTGSAGGRADFATPCSSSLSGVSKSCIIPASFPSSTHFHETTYFWETGSDRIHRVLFCGSTPGRVSV
ncbi:hypothetical protein DFH09DRAFT_1368283, partial [Mycena vulgaris]